MKEKLSQSYESLYNDYGKGKALKPVRQIKSAINSALKKNGQISLRPDGKYFLLINFYQMIYLPLSNVYATLPNLDNIIFEDVRRIIDAAAQNRHPGENEISGNEILRVTASMLGKLESSAENIWG